MKLNIKELESETSQTVLRITPEDIDPAIARLAGEGAVELVIFNNKTELVFNAKVKAAVMLECSRCLSEFQLPLDLEFDFSARPGVPKPGDEDEENVLFYSVNDSELDITGIVTEEISVSMPMKPECSEDCKGLCPGCGKDLNEKACTCKAKSANPAWEALRKLKME